MSRLGYRAELDGLRAFAVIAVIAYHYLEEGQLEGGFLGVDVFFVLSGFLITRLLLEERAARSGIDLRGFYLRRAARLLPAILLVSFVCMLDALTLRSLGSVSKSLFGVIGSLGYFTNWARVFNYDTALGHTWSLSIEEQFYLLWPAALVVLYRWRSLKAVRIGAAVVLAVSAVQMAARSLLGVSANTLYNATDTHGGVMLMAGCLLATVMPVDAALRDHPLGKLSRRAAPVVIAALIVLLVNVPNSSSFYYRGGLVIVAALCSLLVARALQPGTLATILCLSPVVWVGRLSYGLYLWHYPVWISLRNQAPQLSETSAIVLALLITVVAATASYSLVEMPIRRAAADHLKRRAAPTVSASPVSALTPGT